MIKRVATLFLIMLFFSSAFAVGAEQGGYAGTPPGFYDDIKEENADDDIAAPHQNIKENENDYGEQSGEFSAGYGQVKPTKDYSKIYNELEPADFSYLHEKDPDEYYDMKDAAWSTYPLFRLNSAIYFKNTTIEPGYYLLTPREHKGKWYMLFKQNGKVVHIIPAYERDYTPETFYDEHIPKPKLTRSQKIHMKALEFVGKFNSSQRKEPVKSFLEVNDLENYFVSVIVYYGSHKYSLIFRTIRL